MYFRLALAITMDDYLWIDFLINAVLAIIMLGIGLSLTVIDFKNIFVHPRSLITALAIQLLIVPAVAMGIAWLSDLSPEMKVGMVVVSLCASGASSNLITHLFKGNVALAISMTTINSLITLVSVPIMVNVALIVFLGVQREISLPFGETVIQIFIVTILPAFLGILIRRWREKVAKALERPLKFILPAMLATVFTVKIFLSEGNGGTGISMDEIWLLIGPLLALNFAAMALGFFGGRLIRIPFKDQYTISIEVGLHNTALALLISGTIIQSADMEKPALVYAMFSFFTAILFVAIIRWIFTKK
jgi:BASS family bile acid:Na+ symporter